MKFKKHHITYGIVLVLVCGHLSSSTFLAGTMFYYLVGSYITTEVFPNIIRNTFKARKVPKEKSQQITLQNENSEIVGPPPTNSGPSQRQENSTSESDVSTLESLVQIGNALGVNRRVDTYMKDVWPELDCSLNPCDENGKRIKKKQTKKLDESEEDEEEEDKVSEITISEELAGYKNYATQKEDDAQDVADEELADDDPFNFYYIMKEDYKRQKIRDYRRQQNILSQNSIKQDLKYPETQQNTIFRRPIFPNPLKLPIRIQQFRVPRGNTLPIFIRYKVPYPMNFNGAAVPPPSQHLEYANRYALPFDHNLQKPSLKLLPERRSTVVSNSLFQLSKRIASS